MKRYGRASTLLIVLLLSQALAGGENASFGVGWSPLPNTSLRAVCPPNTGQYGFADRCQNGMLAWNGGVIDTRRARLIVWGGGHNDYRGNEIYAITVNPPRVERLTNPSPPNLPLNTTNCTTSLADGTPNSRHTYGGLAYIEHIDRMFVYGGSLGCGPGHFGGDTWTFSFTTNTWQEMKPSGPQPRYDAGVVAAYDRNTRKVFLHDAWDLFAYTFETNSYQRLASGNHIDYHMTAAVDPVRKKLIIVGGTAGSGGGVSVYDIGARSGYGRQQWTTTGGDRIVHTASPGLAYDPDSDRMVAWAGGDTVYRLNMDTRMWTAHSFSGGPDTAPENGMFGRWGYLAPYGVFVTVTSVDSNAYVLRLADTPRTGDPAPAASPR